MPTHEHLLRLLSADLSLGEAGDAVVCQRDPRVFIDAFTAAVAAGGVVFVADPDWDPHRRALFNRLVATPAVVGDARGGAQGWLCLPTGGSGGGVKLARHDESTLSAAALGFARHFGVSRVNALGLLPLHHVSGLMAWLRTVFTGGAYLPADWAAISAGERPPLPASGDWFISLVPTQLARLLADPEAVDWLRGFRAVLLGGGPAWPELLDRAAAAHLPVAVAYGSTETAAMVAAQRPAEFIAGRRDCGTALPHARLNLDTEGRLLVEAESLFRGYWPEARAPGPWRTDDLAGIDGEGRLRLLGRADALIITGGKKVDPLAIEAVLRTAGRWADVAVVGVPDPDWGSRVVACHTAEPGAVPTVDIEAIVREKLSAAERPKAWVAVTPWPRNAQGKLDRAALARAAARAGA
ncbi:MAG: AMP-binding protein [Verrucomicrobiota bacterium]